MPAHVERLRSVVGHDLLLLPSVSVLPVDETGRVLLVRHAGHHGGWTVLGGAVEIGESPAEAAIREAREEIGADIRLKKLLDVLGGPDYEITYPTETGLPTSPLSTRLSSSAGFRKSPTVNLVTWHGSIQAIFPRSR